ncbi:MAG: Thioredoxin [Alphaproteobacteria bacterium MarineAlpha2_Bin1]|nr:MAG: Thioredoxin [Alphaproteobacteria bacterium MarineAlpha2_Bin1]|tara:strand:- start:652 stop:1557 length:906 start_codon:yes stop_codon:yes gene_type:complete
MVEQLIGSNSNSSDMIKDTSTDRFMEDVIEASKESPVLVDFWAPWCEPCKQLGPILEKVVTNSEGKIKLVKLNIDDDPQIPQQLQIQSIPAVFAFKDGQPIDAFVGVQTETQIKSFIEKLIGPIGPSPVEQALAAAENEFKENNFSAAENLYLQVIGFDSMNPEAIAGLAKVYINNNDSDKAKELLDGLSEDILDHDAIKSALSALSLAENKDTLISKEDLINLINQEPNNLKAKFDLATALAAENEFEKAIENLLEIMKKDKEWNNGEAKEKLLKIFEVLGTNNELTKLSRRKMSSIIFS